MVLGCPPAQVLEQAEYFESWIQGFRRRRLRELFGAEDEILYCSDAVHSQQNRCLISGRLLCTPLPPTSHASADAVGTDVPANGETGFGEEAGSTIRMADGLDSHASSCKAFFDLLERQLLKYTDILPLDLRVRGLVSTKFECDGTAPDPLAWPVAP